VTAERQSEDAEGQMSQKQRKQDNNRQQRKMKLEALNTAFGLNMMEVILKL